jgi:protein-S-isoprenylcysteine O-methyltransferase Ste14
MSDDTIQLDEGARQEDEPAFGSRGEAWVAGQGLLFAVILAKGLRGRRWPPGTRRLTKLLALASAIAGGYLMQQGAKTLGKELTPLPAPTETAVLKTGGVYGIVRHPIYTGGILIFLAWTLWRSPRALLPTVALYFFFVKKSQQEEAWLEERFPEYAAYRERVPARLIPGIDDPKS